MSRQRAEIERLESRMMYSFSASGAETLVNTNKTYAELNPVIAVDGSGNYVVVWSNNGEDGSGWGIYGQRFSASGTPVGSEFRINQTTAGDQTQPAVAMNSSGSFVVSWTSSQNNGDIYAREYDSSGAATGNETLVSGSTTGVQENSAVAIDSAGDLVVAWDGQGPGDAQGIFSQRYIFSSLLGTGLFGTLTAQGVQEVNTVIDHQQYTPSVSINGAGAYVVAWTDRSTKKIKARLGNVSSGLEGSEFLVGTSSSTQEDHASVGIDSAGAFAITWQEDNSGAANWDILARQYNASGVAQEATPIAVNTYTNDDQVSPTLSMGSGGNFIVTWESNSEDGSAEGVFAQAFSSSGTPAGGEFQVNTTTQGNQQDPAAAIIGSNVIIAWDGKGVGDNQGIFQQRYVADALPNVAPTITMPSPQSVAEGAALTFSSAGGDAFTVADSDNDGGVEDVTLVATNGTVTLASGANVTLQIGTGTNDASDIFFGTLSQLNAALNGLVFAPASNFAGSAGIQIWIDDLGNSGTGGALTTTRSLSVNVTPVAHTPSATSATTNENVQSTSGLVITPNSLDTSLSGFFQITGITGGSLFENNGTTAITNGQFITFAQGEAGLRFTPTNNSTASGAFDVQASTSNGSAGLGGSVVADAITISPAPQLAAPSGATTNEDTPLVFSSALADAIVVGDPGNSSGSASVTLAATDGTLTLASVSGITITSGSASGSSSVTFTGTFANLNFALNGLQFTPATHFYGSGALAISVAEGSNTASGSVPVSISRVAHTPSVTSASTNENAQTTNGLVITANALDTSLSGFFQITGITGGSLFQNDGISAISNGQFITFAQGVAGLRFTPSPDSTASGAFGIRASTSNGAAGLGGSVSTAGITISPVPVITAPATGNTSEDMPLIFSATEGNQILVSDPGNPNGAASVALTAGNATLTLASTTGITFVAGGPSGASSDTFTGSFSNLNAALNGLQFVPTTHYSGSASLAATVTEGANSAGATVPVSVNPVAHTPSITSAKTVVNQQTASGLIISRNALDGPVVGYFQITGITGGALYQQDGVTQINDGDFITFAQGSAGLRFTPTTGSTSNGTFEIQASTTNAGSGLGGSSVVATITVAGPPMNQVPGPQTIAEDAPLIFSSSRLISVDDAFIGSGADLVTLTASGGAVTLAPGSGVALSNGTGTNDSSVSFTGTLPKLRAALNGLIFTPVPHYFGAASLQIVTTDPANVGSNGALTATDTVSLTINRVAHQPSATPAQTIETAQTTSGLVITPNPLDASLAGFFELTNIAGGTLFLSDGTTQLADGQFITFAQGHAGLKFTPAAGSAPTGGFDVQASTTSDDTGLGGNPLTVSISVIRRQTVAVESNPLAYTEGQGGLAISPALTITDQNPVPLTGATVRLVGFIPNQDALQFTNQSGISGSWDAANGVLTLTGAASAAAYQAALESVAYANNSQDPSITPRSAQFTVADSYLSSNSVSRAIDVIAINNPPTISSPATQSTIEDVPLTFSPSTGNGITLADVDSEANTEQLTLTATNGTLATSADPNAPASVITLTAALGSLNSALDGLIFTPSLHYAGSTAINVRVDDLGNTGSPGPQTAAMSIAIDVAPIAHTPSVTGAEVEEGHHTSTGLVITPDPADQSLAGYFQITGITGGTLVQNNGVTPINDGDFITFAQGQAGLRFTPTFDSVVPGAFTVQSSVTNSDAGLGGNTVQATILVVAAPLVVQRASLELENEPVVPITTASLYVAGPLGAAETISFTVLSLPQHGTLLLDGAPLNVNDSFTRADVDTGAVSYAPLNGVPRLDSFQFQAEDTADRTTGAATFHIKPQPVPINPLPPIAPSPAPAPDSKQKEQPTPFIAIRPSPGDSGSTPDSEPAADPIPSSGPGDVSPPAGVPAAIPAAAPSAKPGSKNASSTAQNAAISKGNAQPTSAPAEVDATASRLTRESVRAEFASTRTLLAGNSKLWVDLDAMKQNMHSEIRVWAGAASFVSMGMSLAYFVWIFRAGSLISSLLSSMPAWNFVDPLPILESIGSARRRHDDDEGLEGLLKGSRGK